MINKREIRERQDTAYVLKKYKVAPSPSSVNC